MHTYLILNWTSYYRHTLISVFDVTILYMYRCKYILLVKLHLNDDDDNATTMKLYAYAQRNSQSHAVLFLLWRRFSIHCFEYTKTHICSVFWTLDRPIITVNTNTITHIYVTHCLACRKWTWIKDLEAAFGSRKKIDDNLYALNWRHCSARSTGKSLEVCCWIINLLSDRCSGLLLSYNKNVSMQKINHKKCYFYLTSTHLVFIH